MSDDIAIKVDGVSKSFKLPHEKHGSIKSALISMGRRNKGYEKQQVLKEVSFEIKKGEFFGIVGRNGSGKSTLLKLLAGIYVPGQGSIMINGKLTPFIELGVGFNPELSGRENVFLNGALLGFNRKEMEAMYDEIVEFAELERFMDQKLKNYSSGMQVRLAFSIAIRARSDILLLDEVLAVGDALFQKKCYDYFKQLKKDKKTVVFVSHDTNALQEYCDRGVLINEGKLIDTNNINRIIDQYIQILNKKEDEEVVAEESGQHIGDGSAKIESVRLHNGQRKKVSVFTEVEKNIYVEVKVKSHKNIEDPIYGLSVYDASGQRIVVINNYWSQIKMKKMLANDIVEITWKIPNIFASGTFTITPAIASKAGTEMHDSVEAMATFKVRKRQISNAYTNLEYDVSVRKVDK